MTTRSFFSLLLSLVVVSSAPAADPTLELVDVQKIWANEKHNAFTDLIRFQDHWLCTFREADGHIAGDGVICILSSKDGKEWKRHASIAEPGIDLRDPKFSIMPDGRLMIVAGGSLYKGGKTILGRMPRVTFSKDSVTWTAPLTVPREWEWLWRVTWHKSTAYGVSYTAFPAVPPATQPPERILRLLTSQDGEKWKEHVTDMKATDIPGETTLRFLQDGTGMAFTRRGGGNKHGWIGTSPAPYTEWTWKDAGDAIGGPNFIELPDGTLVGGGRKYDGPGGPKMVLGPLTRDSYKPQLVLPSGKDNSYPGLVWHDKLLWVSYYSSHEGRSNIYLARVKVTPAKP
jgi:hypothetical protein